MDFLTLTIGKQKNIALIAHDSKKHEMIEWCEANKEILKGHFGLAHAPLADGVSPRQGKDWGGVRSGRVFRGSGG